VLLNRIATLNVIKGLFPFNIDQHSSVVWQTCVLIFAWLEDDIAIQATVWNLVQSWIVVDSASM
jgi:hypothetical protein